MCLSNLGSSSWIFDKVNLFVMSTHAQQLEHNRGDLCHSRNIVRV